MLKEKFKSITGVTDDEYVQLLFLRAENYILAQTNRTRVSYVIEGVIFELALHLHKTKDTELESSRSQGGISVNYITGIPSRLENLINSFKLVRVSGNVFERE